MRLTVAGLILPLFAASLTTGSAWAEDGAPSRFSLLLGGGASVQPVYEGSDDYRVAPFPIIAPSFGESDGPRRFEFRGLDDIRIHAVHMGGFSFGPLAGYRFGRDESDSARLFGLGDVDGGLVVGGFVNYDFAATDTFRFGADVAVSGQVTGDVFANRSFARGTDYGLETDVALSVDQMIGDTLGISARAGAVFASDDYMDTGFGVNAAQAAASGLAPYDPDAGFKNAYVKVGATYFMTERFELRAGVGYSRLVGDAAASPITAAANQFSGYLGAAYRFKF